MIGLTCCTLVLEFNYGKPGTSLGSIWLFDGNGLPHLESSEPLDSIPGWRRVAGPIDYETAAGIHSSLKKYLEGCGVTVIAEGVAD